MTCVDCSIELVPIRLWRSWTPEQREQSGCRGAAGEQCQHCYREDMRHGRRTRHTWKLEELIEEADFLLDGGAHKADVARRLGLKYDSLVRAYKRGRERGLTTRQMSYDKELA